MKSAVVARLFLMLPWLLIVLIIVDIEPWRPSVRSPVSPSQLTRSPRLDSLSNQSIPTIYAITPTYSRPVQKAELTRLANTFRQLSHFHWVLVEDSTFRSRLVTELLAHSGVLSYTHVPTPRRYKRPGLPQATEQRNQGLRWVRRNRSLRSSGVVFFADDDNTYSLKLFRE
eukprot:g32742.t1